MDGVFPSRKEIIDSKKTSGYQDRLIDEIKSIDVEKIDFTKGDFKARAKITEKQKVYFWIRLYLKDEDIDSNPDDTVEIRYNHTGEILETKFICYSKKNLDKDNQDQIVNFESEDDKKVLCLMVDSDRINKESDDIPFIRSLFKISKFYDYQLLKRDDLTFTNKSNGRNYEYFDVSF